MAPYFEFGIHSRISFGSMEVCGYWVYTARMPNSLSPVSEAYSTACAPALLPVSPMRDRSMFHSFAFDRTKLSVHTRDIGLAGIEVYDHLRDDYGIQIEFGDIGNILAYLSIGDRPQELERLVSALAEIKRRYHRDSSGLLSQEYIDPEVVLSPQAAFYSSKRSMPLMESAGYVCSEFVMCYPPGIPILAPGERITQDILDKIVTCKRVVIRV